MSILIKLPSALYGKIICLSVFNNEYVPIPFSSALVGLKKGFKIRFSIWYLFSNLSTIISSSVSKTISSFPNQYTGLGLSALVCIPLKIFTTSPNGLPFSSTFSIIFINLISVVNLHGFSSNSSFFILIFSCSSPVQRSISEVTFVYSICLLLSLHNVIIQL